MADRSTRPTSLPPGRSPWRSGATTFRSARLYRCSWPRSWQLLHFSSCAMCAAGGMRHDHDDGDGNSRGRPGWPNSLRQHLARPAPGAVLVLFFLDPFCDLLSDATCLHVYYLAQIERGNFGGNQPVVGLPSHAVELYRPAYPEPIPDILSQFRDRVDLRGVDHDGGQHLRGVCFGKNAVLGFGDFGDRGVSYLLDPGIAAVHSFVQDFRLHSRQDRDRADQSLVGTDYSLSDPYGSIRNLADDRLFLQHSEGAG